ncbi:hypothetical protein [Thalassoroseus pseudoceratinae]|uniref:hypothetical protein n=1 Tax=Thalassoroseus pseudoceratinae TaxID=2713176 RepID=UPI001F10A5DA|nr:hypothetical protein [Thalassoroseus pseudoceratinae]
MLGTISLRLEMAAEVCQVFRQRAFAVIFERVDHPLSLAFGFAFEFDQHGLRSVLVSRERNFLQNIIGVPVPPVILLRLELVALPVIGQWGGDGSAASLLEPDESLGGLHAVPRHRLGDNFGIGGNGFRVGLFEDLGHEWSSLLEHAGRPPARVPDQTDSQPAKDWTVL